MTKITKEQPQRVVSNMKTYSDFELKAWDDKSKQYFEDKPDRDGKIRPMLNLRNMQEDYGAINRYGGIIVKLNEDGSYDLPHKVQEFENLYEQWQNWKGRNSYVEKKKLEDLELLSLDMTSKFEEF